MGRRPGSDNTTGPLPPGAAGLEGPPEDPTEEWEQVEEVTRRVRRWRVDAGPEGAPNDTEGAFPQPSGSPPQPSGRPHTGSDPTGVPLEERIYVVGHVAERAGLAPAGIYLGHSTLSAHFREHVGWGRFPAGAQGSFVRARDWADALAFWKRTNPRCSSTTIRY